ESVIKSKHIPHELLEDSPSISSLISELDFLFIDFLAESKCFCFTVAVERECFMIGSCFIEPKNTVRKQPTYLFSNPPDFWNPPVNNLESTKCLA
ncbi:hypothetical protein L195_g048139, partial [Trifolium pratense]